LTIVEHCHYIWYLLLQTKLLFVYTPGHHQREAFVSKLGQLEFF